jgi:hypothetical protein
MHLFRSAVGVGLLAAALAVPATGVAQNVSPLPGGATAGLAAPQFDPAVHGFHFPNRFTGSIKVDIPGYGTVDLAHYTFGLCGGMVYAALDTFSAGGIAPPNTTPPAQGSGLRSYIYVRLIDSLRPHNWKTVRKFVEWMALPVDNRPGITGLKARTKKDFKRRIRPELDLGHPVPLGIVKVDLSGRPWDNHQVLAIGYFERNDQWVIEAYDPNFPDTTTYFWLDRRVETSDPAGLHRIDGGHRWRGIFSNAGNYEPKLPFWVP